MASIGQQLLSGARHGAQAGDIRKIDPEQKLLALGVQPRCKRFGVNGQDIVEVDQHAPPLQQNSARPLGHDQLSGYAS